MFYENKQSVCLRVLTGVLYQIIYLYYPSKLINKLIN